MPDRPRLRPAAPATPPVDRAIRHAEPRTLHDADTQVLPLDALTDAVGGPPMKNTR